MRTPHAILRESNVSVEEDAELQAYYEQQAELRRNAQRQVQSLEDQSRKRLIEWMERSQELVIVRVPMTRCVAEQYVLIKQTDPQFADEVTRRCVREIERSVSYIVADAADNYHAWHPEDHKYMQVETKEELAGLLNEPDALRPRYADGSPLPAPL